MAKDSAARQANDLAMIQAQWNQQEAKKAEAAAQLQRDKDQQGMSRAAESAKMVNAMFDGGKYTSTAIDKPLEGSMYYDQTGNQVQYHAPTTKMENTLGKNGKPKLDIYGKPIQHKVTTPGTEGTFYLNKPGEQDFGKGWNDPAFFQGRSDAYTNQYLPEVDRQYRQAKGNLNFSLSDAGLGDSSVAKMQKGQLDLDNTKAIGDVRLKGEAVANDLRSQVNSIRGSLLSNIQNPNDPNSVVLGAQSQLNNISASPVKFDALGDLFSGAGAGIGGYMNGKGGFGYNGQTGGGNTGGGMPRGSGQATR
jgi:hypothetical protein